MAFTPDRKDVSNPSIEVVHDRGANWPEGRSPEWPFDRQERTPISESQARDSNRFYDSAPFEPDEWTPPFYLRYRLLTIGATVLTLAWLSGAYLYVANDLGFDALATLLPHEVGGLFAGIATPVALLWIVAAVYERARIYQGEARALRWHLSRFTYPSEMATGRVSDIAEHLRLQARQLTESSEEAVDRAAEAAALI